MCYSVRCKYEDYMGHCMRPSDKHYPEDDEYENMFKELEYCVFFTERYEEASKIVHDKVKNLSNNDYDINELIEDEIKNMYVLESIQKSMFSSLSNKKAKNNEEGSEMIKQSILNIVGDMLNRDY